MEGGYRKPKAIATILAAILATILAVSVAACGSQPSLEVEMTTQTATLEEAAKCQYIGYTTAGITEKNSTVAETENGLAIDEKLLVEIRGLAGEIGADTVAPVYEDGIVEEFRLYICKARGSVL